MTDDRRQMEKEPHATAQVLRLIMLAIYSNALVFACSQKAESSSEHRRNESAVVMVMVVVVVMMMMPVSGAVLRTCILLSRFACLDRLVFADRGVHLINLPYSYPSPP